MRIRDLLAAESIELNGSATGKTGCFKPNG